VFKEIDMQSVREGFKCRQCGNCCKGLIVPISEEDILRWAVEFRDDILYWISWPEQSIKFVKMDGEKQCPFLEKLACEDIYVCGIQKTKPFACMHFPISWQEATRVGCQGLRAIQGHIE
jgi:Fe-S-cluster containining protein